MTVLPNAPIDADTGLPIPTIAVATDGGVSVIKDDGSVVDITAGTDSFTQVSFTKDNDIITSNQNITWAIGGIPSGDIAYSSWKRFESYGIGYTGIHADFNFLGTHGTYLTSVSQKNIGADLGLTLIEEDIQNKDLSSICYVSSSYNTGWMPGDIKLATLSDTKIETVGEGDNPELITNGQFNSDVSSWTNIDPSGSPDATITWSNGTAQVFRPTGQNGRFFQAIDTIVGAEYFIQIGNYGGSNGGVFVADSDDPSSWNIIANNGAVIKDNNKHYFTATTTSTYIILNSSVENQSVTFDNISVKQTGELITNGTFDNGTTGWTLGASWTISSGVADPGVGASYLDQTISTVSGKRYVAAIEVAGYSAGGFNILFDAVASPLYNSNGVHFHTFTATSSSHLLRIWANDGTVGTVDNISIRLAEEDRSVNDNGLQIFGEIDKTPVAPGADLVAYSGFSEDNYLVQPYNSDLNGLNSFSIMGWVKRNGTITTEQPFISFKDTSDDGVYSNGDTYMLFGTTSNHQLFFQTHEQSTSTDASQIVWSGETIAGDTWVNFCLAYDDSTSTTKIFINGKMVKSATKNTGPVYLSNSVMTIGSRFKPTITGHVCDQVDLSIIRVSATIPTPDQIAKIYRDEKVLFTDGAQATLYGTSDAVTALAYDDKTELLHAGTSSGRSDFAGLRRINNTTTAVTTSISASNNLIAEQ